MTSVQGSGGGSGSMRWLVVSFAGLGATASTVPSSIPALAEEFGTATAALTPAVPALFAGVLAGVLLTPALGRRLAPSSLVRAGAVVQALALLLVAASPTPVLFVAGAAAAGLGFGLVEAAGTASARLGAGADAPRLLVRLTLAVAVLGTLTPLAVLAASSAGAVRLVPVVVAVLQVVVALQRRAGSAAAAVAADAPAQRSSASGHSGSSRSPGRGVLLPLALTGTAIACYVGVETILSGWSAAIVSVELGADAAVAALGTSAFWLLISVGRLVGVVAGRRLPVEGLGIAATAGVALAVGAAALVSEVSAPWAVALLAVAVFFAGPCYALLLGLGLDLVSSARSVGVASALVAVGAAGGVVVPSIAAVLAGSTGEVPVVPAAGAALLMVLALVGSRMLARRRSVVVTPGVPA